MDKGGGVSLQVPIVAYPDQATLEPAGHSLRKNVSDFCCVDMRVVTLIVPLECVMQPTQ